MKTFTKVQVFQDEESDTISMLRPLIKIGIWCGLIGLNVDSQSHSTAVKILHRIYMIGIQILIWFTVLRFWYIALFAGGSTNGRLLAILCAFVFFHSFSYITLLTSYSLTTHYADFCKLMDKHIEKYGRMQKEDLLHKFNKYVVSIGIPILLSMCLAFYSSCYILKDSLKLYLLPFDIEIPWQDTVAMIILFFSVSYHMFHSAVIFVLFIVIWFLFVNEFDHINNKLADLLIERKLLKSESQIERLRQQFVNLVDCFYLYNSIFKHCIFATLSVLLPCVCFWLYGVIRTEQGTEEFALLTIFMLFNFVGVFIIVVLGAALNLKAHQPIAILNKVDVLLINEKTSRSVSMFLTRLHGPPIGFTNYGLFTIDPHAILYIFGNLVTYAVVMLQFAGTDTQITNNYCPTNSSSIMMLTGTDI